MLRHIANVRDFVSLLLGQKMTLRRGLFVVVYYITEPWFVLLALQEAHAVDEDAAVARDSLLQRMLRAGVRGYSACNRSITTGSCRY